MNRIDDGPPARPLSSAFGYGRTRRGKMPSSAGGHRLDAAGHYAQIRQIEPLADGAVDVGGCTLFVGAGLKHSMSSGRYEQEIAAIAAAIGHDRAGRLAVCPTVMVPEYPSFGWRIVNPDGAAVATNEHQRAPWTRAARVAADHG